MQLSIYSISGCSPRGYQDFAARLGARKGSSYVFRCIFFKMQVCISHFVLTHGATRLCALSHSGRTNCTLHSRCTRKQCYMLKKRCTRPSLTSRIACCPIRAKAARKASTSPCPQLQLQVVPLQDCACCAVLYLSAGLSCTP